MEINAHVFYLSSSASAHRDLLKKTPKTNTTTPQKRNQTKPNTPAPLPALDLCGIKVVIGVQTLSNRQAPSSLRPCWPAALCHCIPCQAAAPIHGVCLHLSLLSVLPNVGSFNTVDKLAAPGTKGMSVVLPCSTGTAEGHGPLLVLNTEHSPVLRCLWVQNQFRAPQQHRLVCSDPVGCGFMPALPSLGLGSSTQLRSGVVGAQGSPEHGAVLTHGCRQL